MVEKCAEAGGKTRPRASASAGVITTESACSVAPARNGRGGSAGSAAGGKTCLSALTRVTARSLFSRVAGPPVPPASAVRAGQGRARNRAARTDKMFCAAKDLWRAGSAARLREQPRGAG
jgi:hypothetical protein